MSTPNPTTPHAALTAAERFIAGFEDDDAQEGIRELLATVRGAIADTEPRAPYCPRSHPDQRWFAGLKECDRHLYAFGQGIDVSRTAGTDHARVKLDCFTATACSSTALDMDARRLRMLAAALLDAAHDIEAHPAASLMAQAQEPPEPEDGRDDARSTRHYPSLEGEEA